MVTQTIAPVRPTIRLKRPQNSVACSNYKQSHCATWSATFYRSIVDGRHAQTPITKPNSNAASISIPEIDTHRTAPTWLSPPSGPAVVLSPTQTLSTPARARPMKTGVYPPAWLRSSLPEQSIISCSLTQA
ncbi:hypothetical protein BAUCODRAFT_333270 [Baudoinia panamericana UAMH 10762]|uniref:Uncharacterized protein n=1 Tax=Baudoinia panamericana (strain UAMH 10762) TaxID=717646 RepID=M2MID8_BAUPA|nr:uncharacterized protein BAUCODRAFT_333270 [Baudoinia panamericana UAMH 10762]EMC91028.1 hypothetical protein BAUCODRAFT_333270 [Baudoinia panamericana UAMH 10762]